MGNLSLQRRAEMLEYLNQLKEIHTDDESRIALSKIETALNDKKYGLVWEEHEEEVDKQLVHNIPVFKEVEDRKISSGNDADFNFILEGDNLHSLKLLEKTHKGKIDVIYIDPPYNTGNKDFVYNDTKIGENDGYGHSKWLSFMNERLVIAKELLSDEGVIFISIDDNEHAQLKLLCDEIFGESNHISSFVRKTKSMTGDAGNGLNIQHDYIQIYAKEKLQMRLRGEKNKFKGYSNPDNDPNGTWISGDPSAKSGGESTYFPIENPITGQIDYPPSGRYWAFSKDTFNRYVSNGRIKFREKKRKNHRGFIFKRYAKYNINQYMTIPSLVFNDNIYMNSVATTELKTIFKNIKFDYPKPKSLVKKLVSLFPNSNSIIIDFFAGSGTTGHAVMELNKEDSGTRKYILCTNNENDICEKITYQRMKNIQEELPHSLKYYKTEFIPKLSEDEEILSSKLLDYIKEMVELENMCEIDGNTRRIILSDEDLKRALSEMEESGVLYIPSFILLTNEIKESIEERKLDVVTIPDYYFIEELKEEESH